MLDYQMQWRNVLELLIFNRFYISQFFRLVYQLLRILLSEQSFVKFVHMIHKINRRVLFLFPLMEIIIHINRIRATVHNKKIYPNSIPSFPCPNWYDMVRISYQLLLLAKRLQKIQKYDFQENRSNSNSFEVQKNLQCVWSTQRIEKIVLLHYVRSIACVYTF